MASRMQLKNIGGRVQRRGTIKKILRKEIEVDMWDVIDFSISLGLAPNKC